MSPSVASSPVVGTFADAPKVGRTSPAPAGAPRPASARARQNSTQSSVENPKPRPSSSASNKPNGVAIVLPELAPQTNGARIPHDKAKEIIAPPKPEVPKPADPEPPATSSVTAVVVVRKEPVIKVDESEAKKEKTPSAPVMQTVTTKSGRASKPSTPALATFAEAARSRLSSRASDAATAKRSHKKQASVDATALIAGPPAPAAISARQLDEEEDPLYCYCNTVSYGEMIACDGQGCAREWFHLDCAGLKVAPKGNSMCQPAPRHPFQPPDEKLMRSSKMVLRGLQEAAKSRREEIHRKVKMMGHLQSPDLVSTSSCFSHSGQRAFWGPATARNALRSDRRPQCLWQSMISAVNWANTLEAVCLRFLDSGGRVGGGSPGGVC